MLRLTELKLALGQGATAIPAAILERLGVGADELVDYAIVRRAHDARRKSAIATVYSVDVTLRNEAEVLARGSAALRASES